MEQQPEAELGDTCWACGGLSNLNAKYCRHCGHRLVEIDSPRPTPAAASEQSQQHRQAGPQDRLGSAEGIPPLRERRSWRVRLALAMVALALAGALISLLTLAQQQGAEATASGGGAAHESSSNSGTAASELPARESPADDASEAPGQPAVGPLQIGMPFPQAVSTGLVQWSEPYGPGSYGVSSLTPGFYVCGAYSSQREARAATIGAFLVKDNFDWTTPEGISIGSTLGELKSAYPDLAVLLYEQGADPNGYYGVTRVGYGYQFYVAEGSVLTILFGTSEGRTIRTEC